MNRLVELLKSQPTLIVSLPKNSVELAEAAIAGGADALKVHIHIHHEASGNQFGTLAQERPVLEQILKLGLPTAIVVASGEAMATPEEMAQVQTMGFDAFDAYKEHLPAWMFSLSGIAKMVAILPETRPEAIQQLEAFGTDIIEAAIVPSSGYGKPMMLEDLLCYCALRETTSLPIVIPTQRKIGPAEVPLLFKTCRPNALMIGAIVTGSESDSITRTTAKFKQALLDLPRR